MSVPTVDLIALNPHLEIILRAGDIHQPNAREVLQRNYAAGNPDYPTVIGLSVLFAPGADVLGIVQRNVVPHGHVAHATIQQILTSLQSKRYGMLLYITPDLPRLPDHHQLAVTSQGAVSNTLPDDAVDLLLAVLHDDRNPNPRKQP